MPHSYTRPRLDYPHAPLWSILKKSAEMWPAKAAVIDRAEKITFGELDAVTDAFAFTLNRMGISRGDFAALILPNGIYFAFCYIGALKAGATVVPINPLSKDEEIICQMKDSGSILVMAPGDIKAKVDSWRREVSSLKLFIAAESAFEGAKLTPSGGKFVADINEAVNPREDLAALPYSSGTTGVQKGVMLTHRNLISNIVQFASCCEIRRDDVFFNHLPFFHIYGMNLLMGGSIYAGATQVVTNGFSPEAALSLIEQYKCTVFFTVPPVVHALLNYGDLHKHDLSSLRFIFSGAAPLAAEAGRQLQKRAGVKVVQGYGLTEASPLTNANPLGRVKIASVGPPSNDTFEKIVDAEDGSKEVGTMREGELLVRGPQIMKGYWKNPQATEAALRGDWLHTGDIAAMDEEGYVYIVDRKKEMIKYKAYQVAPAELEALILSHPAVADCAVVGRPDEAAGEVPKAFVVVKEGQKIDAKKLMQFVDEKVAHHKKIREVAFIDQIPRSPSGKILRKALKCRGASKRDPELPAL